MIAVHTTCLSETIGDDIPQIIAKARDDGKIPPGKRVIHTNTPSYVGSHVTGFSNMVKSMVDYFAEPAKEKKKTLNLIPGWVEALQLMPVGSVWKLYIPSALAYGERGVSADIGPNTVLIFEIELLEIVK